MSQFSAAALASMGAVQKAILIIHEEDPSQINSDQISQRTQEMLSGATGALSVHQVKAGLDVAGMQAKVLQVQYNPSTLSIQANAEAIPFTYLQQNIDSGIPNQNLRAPMVVLAVELIFDAMNPKDAFMMDKVRLSAGDAISSAAGIAKNIKDGGYTVQPQTEGLLAALLRPNTRTVTFRWGDMAFTGQLIEVRADYTMFSVSGKPIRSRVFMHISQQVESDSDFQYWNKVLDRTFSSGSDVNLKKPAQQLNNLLNLDSF